MRLIEPNQITKMMSDLYISEDAVNMTGERQGLWVRFRAIEKAVSEIATIDAVEVVRCRDCRHRDLFSCPLTDNDFQKDDDFCSWGERRQNDESDRSDKGAESDDRATSGQE